MKPVLEVLTKFDSQTIIFGGLTLGLMASIWLTFKVVQAMLAQSKHYYNHTNDVIARNTEAWNEHSKTNQKLVDMIEKWHKK